MTIAILNWTMGLLMALHSTIVREINWKNVQAIVGKSYSKSTIALIVEKSHRKSIVGRSYWKCIGLVPREVYGYCCRQIFGKVNIYHII